AGLIAIDTGESVEEMRWALATVRAQTSAPVVAVIYTHFHYVAGTSAVDGAGETVPIWGHERIVANRQRVGVQMGPAAARGLIHQFGIMLPTDGPDGLVNVGLGVDFRRAEHAPFTPGFVEPTDTISEPTSTMLAGLRVEFTPAPSDADDSITIWFPDLGVCINNLAWPALFNVFPIRGEEYRDPRVLLSGFDHMLALEAEHLVGAHGPPLSGRGLIARELTLARDAIQYLWDQTVRGINKGYTLGELTDFVQLPEVYESTYFTQQLYGLVEHHVKQIHAGLRGWFDGDDALLFPMAPADRAERLVERLGGPERVRIEVAEAIDADDLRWALELSSWLVRRSDSPTGEDQALLARSLRTVAQRTTSANLRNYCLTRALELEGTLDLSRFRVHRLARELVAVTPPTAVVAALGVVLDPDAATGLDEEIRWRFSDGSVTGLHVRNGVAVPTSGETAQTELRIDLEVWPGLVGGKVTLDESLADGSVTIDGSVASVRQVVACLDFPGFA
ncbi:MAG: alkyl sulfatase dimerization domain-containing protein, partial [Acidimicrobiia bacterium]|nr:alkyl sulfatase dimerization domain-containing protein [Acidimicrobiia bacterium]